ncbi:hypothetical protein [Marinobacter sp. NFXS9]|uniref:hypothetical protein n=1 Tax=Marinobacter sp. NFXS9 TaxID=2818433 RepID=UPI0032DE697A
MAYRGERKIRTLRCRFGSDEYRLNGDEPGGWVPIQKRTGDDTLRSWLGTIDKELAKRIPGARPVKIRAHAYSSGKHSHRIWFNLKDNEAVQGCLFNEGVFAVLDRGEFKIVKCQAPGPTPPPEDEPPPPPLAA